MKEDATSSENPQEEEGAFQDVHVTEKEPDEVPVQPKKWRQPQWQAKATNRTIFQRMEEKLQWLEHSMFEVSTRFPPKQL